ncbi:leucine-rich repeat-containing protein 53-like [Penaeus indicus]|uniref:leucine-rich repeat-containing protein 53-like n=1 Tax=Penaeus indicus TaxID=29960 RepID=UPI00300C192F
MCCRYLKDLGLERLPPLGNLHSLEALYLSSNRIKSVENLSLTGMLSLRELDLSRNRLTTMSSPPFKSVKLRKLNLSRNYISYLDTQSFESLPHLEELKLSTYIHVHM